MSGVYEANPAGLRRSIEMMKQLPEMAKRLGTEFREEEDFYTEWPGWTDDFAMEVRPKYNENNEYCLGISTGLYSALDALVSATLGNLENIEGTQAYTSEQIQDYKKNMDSEYSDPEGGGKH